MTVEQAARDFFGWFNRHYPVPSTNPDHEWNRLGVALTNHQEEAQVRGLTATNSVHTCSYHCERPECVRAQRDELRDRMESALAAPHPAITHCDHCGCDWLDNGLNPVGCPYCKQSEQAAEIGALREALKVLVNWTPSADTYRRLGFNPEAPMRAHEAAKALLKKENKA